MTALVLRGRSGVQRYRGPAGGRGVGCAHAWRERIARMRSRMWREASQAVWPRADSGKVRRQRVTRARGGSKGIEFCEGRM